MLRCLSLLIFYLQNIQGFNLFNFRHLYLGESKNLIKDTKYYNTIEPSINIINIDAVVQKFL